MEKMKRIEWIDTAKGIGILAVIMGHCIRAPYPFAFAAYIFHVPLFFILSGFLFSSDENFEAFFIKKVRWLLIPYCVLSLGIVLFTLFWNGKTAGIEMAVTLLVQRRRTTLWFLATLFVTLLLFYIIVSICRYNKKWILVVACFVSCAGVLYDYCGLPVLPWNIDGAFVAVLFVAVGYAARDLIRKVIECGGVYGF